MHHASRITLLISALTLQASRVREVLVKDIFICGSGAVSPAGWGVAPLMEALSRGEPLTAKELARPGVPLPLRVRAVPPPNPRPAFLAHPRVRRSSPIAQYAVAAAIEALGEDASRYSDSQASLGVVLCVMSGCVNYSRRFYDETLKDPATASPLVFPETVFNAPASHIAALLGTTAINYTLVGDPGTFLQGLALAASWLLTGRVEGCLVIGAEELDWLTADAFRLFSRNVIVADGAGALYLRRDAARAGAVRLDSITNSYLFSNHHTRAQAAAAARGEIGEMKSGDLLCDGLQDVARLDADERGAWQDWTGARLSPKVVLGEGLMSSAAWQCVVAVETVRQKRCGSAVVSLVGCNQQAIAARFSDKESRAVTAP